MNWRTFQSELHEDISVLSRDWGPILGALGAAFADGVTV